mmetsp:Transcript_478/g.1839  ORF Transcript_478/g.1839 Transcript_478/m.1839 type:complete len:229 (-) Transcript_478:155-841(-)
MRVVVCRLGSGRGGHGNLAILVQVPVLAPRGVRVVRVDERREQAERARVLASARVVVDRPQSGRADLVVVLELVRDGRDARLHDGAGVVIPQIYALVGSRPVGHPAIITWIDIGRVPFFEAVELIGPHKVHLARDGGPIPEVRAEIVREGRHRRRHIRRVVVAARFRPVAPRHERVPPRRAQRRVAVRRREPHAVARLRMCFNAETRVSGSFESRLHSGRRRGGPCGG